MAQFAAGEWHDTYKIGKRSQDDQRIILFTVGDLLKFRKHCQNGETPSQAIQRTANEIARKRQVTARYSAEQKYGALTFRERT